MAKTYKTPGVYIKEISEYPTSVVPVETAIPVFIGYTEKADLDGTPIQTSIIDTLPIAEAKRINSLLEYERYFGKAPLETFTVTIKETYKNGTNELKKRVLNVLPNAPSIHTLYYHMRLYFANGGGPCYIISVGNITSTVITTANLLAGLKMAQQYDEPTLLVIPQADKLSTSAEAATVYKSALVQAGTMKDRFVIMDCHNEDIPAFKQEIGTTFLKYGAVYYPFLHTSINYLYDLNVSEKINLILKQDFSETGTFTTVDNTTLNYGLLNFELQSLIESEIKKLYITLPPSATVAGVYVKVDKDRGVWKAPANVSLNSVLGTSIHINADKQAGLNVDKLTGKSINVIKSFAGKGILIWGSRTLAGNDNEWRYVPVRRFFNMIEESSIKALKSFVFEPNDVKTWQRVQHLLEDFLITLWKQGALQGTKTAHAFYVSIGLNKTMTTLDILEGRMIVEIGMAVVRPAEFIIFRIQQKMEKK